MLLSLSCRSRRGILTLSKVETVQLPSGIDLHFGFDPPDGKRTRSAANPLGAVGGWGGIIFKNEIYATSRGQSLATGRADVRHSVRSAILLRPRRTA